MGDLPRARCQDKAEGGTETPECYLSGEEGLVSSVLFLGICGKGWLLDKVFSGSYSWSQPPTLCWLPHPLPLILVGLLHFSLHTTFSVPSSFSESRLREEEEFRRHIVLTASL